jgi:ribonuclease E
MTKRMLIDAAHPEETRVVVMDGSRVEEFDLEAANRLPLKGNIYLARVVRVEPSLQAAFVEYGGNRHGFLAFDEIHPDYYQIPVADREKLLALQAAEAREEEEAEDRRAQAFGRRESRRSATPETPSEGAPADIAVEASVEIPAEASAETPAEASAETPAEASAEPTSEAESYGRVEQLPPEDMSPPETLGGPEGDGGPEGGPEAMDEGDDRPRRAAARFLRNYKIQEVIRRRQVMLVQVVKEERGTKGAALTTYISLAGRFSVLMPNSPRGGGVSRKITSAADRRRLREVIDELEMPVGMSLIVRTAGANRPKPEIRRDCEYLLSLWDSIRERTLASTAPALIYEEADLIKRAIRDGTAQQMDEIWVEGDEAYAQARDFVRMLMPEQSRRIQAYRDGAQPLFARFQAEAQLDAMHEPVVQLRSGGYIVINQTEALVAIDVNSGRATRERHIEDTALKTNLEAAEEVARQLRLRDLAGLIVVDFIDMDSAKHNAAVEKRMKDALRHDRARIQVGRISHFGLLEMSRQRLRPSLAEQSFVQCPHCTGRGLVRSVESSAIAVLRAIEEEGARRRSAEITVRVTTPVTLWLLNRKRDRLAEIEASWGMSVLFEPDDTLQGAETRIERSREAPAPRGAEARPTALRMDFAPEAPDEAEAPRAAPVDATDEAANEEQRRRRRRRRRGGRREPGEALSPEAETAEGAEAGEAEGEPSAEEGSEAAAGAGPAESAEEREARRRRRGRRGGRRRREDAAEAPVAFAEAEATEAEVMSPAAAYAGPTPADPFAGTGDSLLAAMEAAEAAAEAEAEARSRAPVAPTLPIETIAAVVVAAPLPQPAEPVTAEAPAPAEEAAAEPVIGPAVQPKLVEQAEAPRRGGWWKR